MRFHRNCFIQFLNTNIKTAFLSELYEFQSDKQDNGDPIDVYLPNSALK